MPLPHYKSPDYWLSGYVQKGKPTWLKMANEVGVAIDPKNQYVDFASSWPIVALTSVPEKIQKKSKIMENAKFFIRKHSSYLSVPQIRIHLLSVFY